MGNSDSGACPLCLEERREYDRHHVIWRCDGGTNDPVNLLDICKTCHAVLTYGNSDDARQRDLACLYYQWAQFGLAFAEKSGLCSETYAERYPEDWAYFKPDNLRNSLNAEELQGIDAHIRDWTRWQYLYKLAGIGVLDPIWNDDDFDSNYNPNWKEPKSALGKALAIRDYQRGLGAAQEPKG